MILTCLHIARFTPLFFYLVILSSWSLLVCQVHFAKCTLPNCQFYIAKSTFPSHQLHIVNVTLQSCQVHLTLWTARNELQAAHKLKCFWVVQCLNFFFGLPKPLPLIFSFFTSCLGSPALPPSSPLLSLISLSLALFSFHLIALWSLRGALSKFKVPTFSPSFSFDLMALWNFQRALSKFKVFSKWKFEHIECKLKGFEFKFYVFYVSIFMHHVKLKPS